MLQEKLEDSENGRIEESKANSLLTSELNTLKVRFGPHNFPVKLSLPLFPRRTPDGPLVLSITLTSEAWQGFKYKKKSNRSFVYFGQDEHTCVAENLKETEAKLKETIASRDKLSSNFDETEKLYVQRIKCIQEELQETHVTLHKTSKE